MDKPATSQQLSEMLLRAYIDRVAGTRDVPRGMPPETPKRYPHERKWKDQ